MATPTVYVICDQNCKFEGMTKEQILSAIMQAVNDGTISDIDAGFITKIKTVNGRTLKFFVGEQADYDALSDETKADLFAIITNENTKEAFISALEEVTRGFEELSASYESILSGDKAVGKAEIANKLNAGGTAGLSYNRNDLPVVFVEGSGQNKKTHSTYGFTFNPSTRTLKVDNFLGNASTADRATSAGTADHADNATTADEAKSLKCGFAKVTEVYDGDALFEIEIPNGVYACDFTSRTGIRSCGVVTILDNELSRDDKYSPIGDGVVIHWWWHTFHAGATGTGKEETWLKAQILVDGERDIEANGYIHLYQIAKL